MSDDDERGGGEDGNIEIYLRLKPIANPSKKVTFDLAEGKARRGRWRRKHGHKHTHAAAAGNTQRAAQLLRWLRAAAAAACFTTRAAAHAARAARRWRSERVAAAAQG